MHFLFPCLSKSALEQVDRLLKLQLKRNKRARNWSLIGACLAYWTHYARVVRVWTESGDPQVVRNGRQLFEFLLGLRPGVNAAEVLRSLSGREKFLEEALIYFCESIFSLLQVHGGKRVYQVSTHSQATQIDWDRDIEDEDEARIADLIERQMEGQELAAEHGRPPSAAFGLGKSASVSYRSSMRAVVDYPLLDVLLARLHEQSFAFSPETLNLAVASLLEKIVAFFEGRPLWLFFHTDYLRVLLEFVEVENALLRKQESFKRVSRAVEQIFGSYCRTWKANSLLPMESLFRFRDVSRVNRVLKNYPQLRGDGQADLDLHSRPEARLGDLRDQLEEELGDASVFVHRRLWTEREDLLLVQNFPLLVVQDRVFARLRDLLRRTLNSDKTLAQVRKRIELLGLGQVSQGEARVKMQTLHGGALNFQRVLKSVLQGLPLDQRGARWAAFALFARKVISDFASFKLEFPDSLEEFAVVPSGGDEFKAVFVFQGVLQAMGLINPRGKRAFWRVPIYVLPEELSKRLDRFESVFEGLGPDLKAKSKKRLTPRDIDKEFAELVREEFEFDVGGGEAGAAPAKQTESPAAQLGKARLTEQNLEKPRRKRRLKRLSKRAGGKPKKAPAKAKAKAHSHLVGENQEIEGLELQSGSEVSSVVSHGSSSKENLSSPNGKATRKLATRE